ncbi:hypothetical protein N7533_006381 [Penicillium manginii]|uniref:uncharacterized protein n=1 Tax=Penicillium manginii TaxID=203109 RepID=UPI0025474FEB|nr:uncharacterized protein N7533_006381 [Penicillium manginii]KAJ5756838.1 hypothetical protein N7533_006381 [Penicillium manginii]
MDSSYITYQGYTGPSRYHVSQETDPEICEISYEEWASQESYSEMYAISPEEFESSERARLIRKQDSELPAQPDWKGTDPVNHQIDQEDSEFDEMISHGIFEHHESLSRPEPSHNDREAYTVGENSFPEMLSFSHEEWTEKAQQEDQRRRLIEYEAWDLLLQDQTKLSPEMIIESAFPLPQSQVILPSIHWILSGSRGAPVWGPSP